MPRSVRLQPYSSSCHCRPSVVLPDLPRLCTSSSLTHHSKPQIRRLRQVVEQLDAGKNHARLPNRIWAPLDSVWLLGERKTTVPRSDGGVCTHPSQALRCLGVGRLPPPYRVAKAAKVLCKHVLRAAHSMASVHETRRRTKKQKATWPVAIPPSGCHKAVMRAMVMSRVTFSGTRACAACVAACPAALLLQLSRLIGG